MDDMINKNEIQHAYLQILIEVLLEVRLRLEAGGQVRRTHVYALTELIKDLFFAYIYLDKRWDTA